MTRYTDNSGNDAERRRRSTRSGSRSADPASRGTGERSSGSGRTRRTAGSGESTGRSSASRRRASGTRSSDEIQYDQNLTPRRYTNRRSDIQEMEQELAEAEREGKERKKRRAARKRKEQARRKRVRMIRLLVLAAVVILCGILLVRCALGRRDDGGQGEKVITNSADYSAVSSTSTEAVPEENTENDVSLAAVGDNLIHPRIYEQAQARSLNGGYDFTYTYQDVKSFIKKHEIAWINCETLINDDIEPAGYPYFSTPAACGEALYEAGFNVFSIGNNHSYDLGVEGIEATLNFWQIEMPDDIVVTGLWDVVTVEGSEPYEETYTNYAYYDEEGNWRGTDGEGNIYYFDEYGEVVYTGEKYTVTVPAETTVAYNDIPIYRCSNGKTVAFLTYTEMTNGDDSASAPRGATAEVIYLWQTDIIKEQIEIADRAADAVVVSCHWGTEDDHTITDDQRKEAQFVADCGADLIIGCHPHVIQDAEWIETEDGRKVFCAYSLGNFISTQQSADNMIGLALDCTLRFRDEGAKESDPEVTIVDPKLIPLITDYGTNGTDCHVTWFEGYTSAQASAHGITDTYPNFSLDYIRRQLTDYVDPEFLQMD